MVMVVSACGNSANNTHDPIAPNYSMKVGFMSVDPEYIPGLLKRSKKLNKDKHAMRKRDELAQDMIHRVFEPESSEAISAYNLYLYNEPTLGKRELRHPLYVDDERLVEVRASEREESLMLRLKWSLN
jgi:hypothetical protein